LRTAKVEHDRIVGPQSSHGQALLVGNVPSDCCHFASFTGALSEPAMTRGHGLQPLLAEHLHKIAGRATASRQCDFLMALFYASG